MGQQLDKPFNINIACCNSYDEEIDKDNVDADVSCDEEDSPNTPTQQRDDDDELKQ